MSALGNWLVHRLDLLGCCWSRRWVLFVATSCRPNSDPSLTDPLRPASTPPARPVARCPACLFELELLIRAELFCNLSIVCEVSDHRSCRRYPRDLCCCQSAANLSQGNYFACLIAGSRSRVVAVFLVVLGLRTGRIGRVRSLVSCKLP